MKKLLKYVVCLAILVMVVALFTGCKATGGGWFIDERSGNKCTFGFNAQSRGEGMDWEYKGQFQFNDHNGTKIHVEEMTLVMSFDPLLPVCDFMGNDKDGEWVNVIVTDMGEPGADPGDLIVIITESKGSWGGVLEGGNIQVHPTK